jgi:alkyl hydroperoxide reductase subunit D
MSWVEGLQSYAPAYAKDTRLNLSAVLTKSSLDEATAMGCALAVAYALDSRNLVTTLAEYASPEVRERAHVAAMLMAQNNIWYPYAEVAGFEDKNPRLRMNGIVQYGGPEFEAYSLAASIVGKCHFCVRAHVDGLKKHGWTAEQIRDIGRVTAVIASLSKA